MNSGQKFFDEMHDRLLAARKMQLDTGELDAETHRMVPRMDPYENFFNDGRSPVEPVSGEVIPLEDPAIGYHLNPPKRGVIGEISKIREELEELEDAVAQGIKVMELVELSDLIGAVECYLEAKHPGTSLEDLVKMKDVTRRAFKNGRRK